MDGTKKRDRNHATRRRSAASTPDSLRDMERVSGRRAGCARCERVVLSGQFSRRPIFDPIWRTLFKEMVFEDLRRVQLDIETTGLDPSVPDNRILIAALRASDGDELVLTAMSEEALLADLSAAITRLDPDVIEGHNIYNFDLPFIVERASHWSPRSPGAAMALRSGLDGGASVFASAPSRTRTSPHTSSAATS